ncbi:MAG: uroporphyrinogen-III C-methyltransferase [Planctomycetaceae bacterium]|nr:uroporphyrinogen-III C-methyltransferase [Planctomycetaceae bacterium]
MANVGTVFLVGAGPGDPGLLTLRGCECLAQADEVLFDGLVNPLLLRLTSAHTTRTCRESAPEGRRLDQSAINARLIELARAGKTIVRLKGGDPFIFGRGAEEAEALSAAGIPYEIVPGVTAATAAAEYAGFALTHRESASAVAYITGHEDPQKPQSNLDYAALARFPGTLVFYMGLHRLPEIAAALIRHGMSARMPAAVISRASTPRQRTIAAPLEELADRVVESGLKPPSLIIVGPCVDRRQGLSWYEQKPLLGKRIGITRPDGQADPQIARALALGADPVLMPVIRIEPVTDWTEIDAVIARLDQFDWIVWTSANGVRALLGRLWETGGDVRRLAGRKIAAIGSATAEAMAEFHLRADVVPEEFRAETLADALEREMHGQRVLWARASRGRDVLPQRIAAAGGLVTELVVYRNEDAQALPETAAKALAEGGVDWVGLSSPSIARQFAALVPESVRRHLGTAIRLAAISPVTEQAARQAGLPISATAEIYTWDGIFDAILHAEGHKPTTACELSQPRARA